MLRKRFGVCYARERGRAACGKLTETTMYPCAATSSGKIATAVSRFFGVPLVRPPTRGFISLVSIPRAAGEEREKDVHGPISRQTFLVRLCVRHVFDVRTSSDRLCWMLLRPYDASRGDANHGHASGRVFFALVSRGCCKQASGLASGRHTHALADVCGRLRKRAKPVAATDWLCA